MPSRGQRRRSAASHPERLATCATLTSVARTKDTIAHVRARDDFAIHVLRVLANEAGNRCSNPICRAPTAGPSRERGASNVGVGAHITAASPGGPRFDASLTPAKRKSCSNGVWLCGRCARLIDNDVEMYTVVVLARWKQQAIETAQRELEAGGKMTEADAIAAIYEAPGLDEVRRVAFSFNRPRGWEQVQEGLRRIAPYAIEGTIRQRQAVLEALARLATYVRTPMPETCSSISWFCCVGHCPAEMTRETWLRNL